MATFDEYLQALKAVITENDDRDALMGLEDTYGTSTAVVATARPLSAEVEAEVRKVLEHQDAVEEVKFVVDPALIGGVKIRVGEREVDHSIISRLRQFAD